MRKHVKPADPNATIPDPERGRDLLPEGRDVAWSAYWAGLAAREDVLVSEIPEPPVMAEASEPQPEVAEVPAPEPAAEPEPEAAEAGDDPAVELPRRKARKAPAAE